MERLDYLMTIAEEKNITRAAAKLFVSQPALTKYIKNLEREYGVQLLERSHNSVSLTRAGQIFLNEKIKIAVLEQQLRHNLKNISENRVNLSIGCGNQRGIAMIPVLEAFLKRYPDTNIDFHVEGELKLFDKIRRQEIDLGIGVFTKTGNKMVVEELKTEMMGLLIPISFGVVPEGIDPADTVENPYMLKPEQLEGLNFITSDNSLGSHINYSALLQQYDINHNRIITSNNALQIRKMISLGLGYGCGQVSEDGSSLKNENGIFTQYRCTLPGLPTQRTVSAAYLRENEKEKLIQEYIKIIRDKMS